MKSDDSVGLTAKEADFKLVNSDARTRGSKKMRI